MTDSVMAVWYPDPIMVGWEVTWNPLTSFWRVCCPEMSDLEYLCDNRSVPGPLLARSVEA